MGFKENLKSELNYAGMTVIELSAITGIKKHTLDNYLNTHNSIPNATAAVKIAQALKVSVEYLITGKESFNKINIASISKDLNSMLDIWSRLSKKKRDLAISLIKTLEKHDILEK